MRRRYVQMPDGELVETTRHYAAPIAPEVMPDIAPYVSQIDGRVINSRSVHRTHLKDNGMVELGNDSSLRQQYNGIPDVKPKERLELIRAQVDAMSNDQFKAAIKRDIDRIKWETRS